MTKPVERAPTRVATTRVSTNRERPRARGATATRARRGAMLRRLRDVALSIPVVITINDCVGSVAPANLAHLPVAPAEAGDRWASSPGTVVPSSSGRAHPERALVVLDRGARRELVPSFLADPTLRWLRGGKGRRPGTRRRRATHAR